MKNLLALLIVSLACTSYAGNDPQAIDFNDKIISEQSKISKKILDFSAEPTESSLQEIASQAKSSLETLDKMKPYDNNKEFLQRAKDLFSFYLDITKNEYKDVLQLIIDRDKYKDEELTGKMNQLISSISSKEKPLDEKFDAAQKAFAVKYGFTLQKNELQEQINDAAGKGN